MRKVLMKKWIPAQFPNGANSVNCHTTHRMISGTGTWAEEYTEPGMFHEWANAYTEFETGPGNYTVGIVELPNGTITLVEPSRLKFVVEEEEKRSSRCCGRCDGVNDICVADMTCDLHGSLGCELCYGKR